MGLRVSGCTVKVTTCVCTGIMGDLSDRDFQGVTDRMLCVSSRKYVEELKIGNKKGGIVSPAL